MELTKTQKAVIVGTLLGDAYLQKTGAKNARLRLEHSLKQEAYLLWKVEMIGARLFQGSPKRLAREHPLTKKTYYYIRHQSNTSPVLGRLRKKFYSEQGSKRVPIKIDQMLTEPLALAVWFMDDGYYYSRDKVAYLYLGKCTSDGAKRLKEVLKENFGLNTRILDKKRKGLVIYFSPQETLKLVAKIEPFVIPEMKYKLPL